MKRFILNIIVLLTAVSAIANDRLYINDFEVAAGESKTIALILDNDTAYSAFQTDIYLSEGLEIEQEDGEYIIDLNTERTAKSHVVSSFKREDGAIRIFVTSQNLALLKGNSGDIAYIQIRATNAFPGSGTISLKNSIAAEANATRHVLPDCVAKAGNQTALQGDVDCDGNVSIADVTAIIDYLLSGNTQSINEENSDVDHDGAISISDVTALIDYLLSGHWPEPEEPEPTPVITPYTVNGVTFNMVEVEGGTFQMGATAEQEENSSDNERPVHQVTLSGFNLGQTEVTQELWQAVMGTNPSKFNDNVNKPVENVSWEDCQTFITALNELTGQNFRLPTEAEWEFAARGGMKSQGYKYSGSNDLNEIAWYNYNAYAVGSSSPDYGTHPVSTKAANELGLYDMTGNVWEWCQDWSGDYSAADQINPTGPDTGTNRVIRGGGWTNYPKLLRVAARSGNKPGFIGNFIGFRLAL